MKFKQLLFKLEEQMGSGNIRGKSAIATVKDLKNRMRRSDPNSLKYHSVLENEQNKPKEEPKELGKEDPFARTNNPKYKVRVAAIRQKESPMTVEGKPKTGTNLDIRA